MALRRVGCAAKAAEADESVWLSCPTCKQIWTGALFVKLARHRYTSSSQLPEDDPDRLAAGVTYVHALLKSAQIAECIRVAARKPTRKVTTFVRSPSSVPPRLIPT